MDARQEPIISGPMFPHSQHDKGSLPPARLKGTIIGIRPGRKAEGATQILTIKLEEWEHHSNKLVNSEVELLFHYR